MALVTARKYGIDASIVHRATFLAETFDRLCRSGQNKSNVSSNTSGDGGDSGAQQVLRGLHAATKDSKSEDSNTVESDLEDSTASVTTPAAAAAAVSATPPPPGRRYNLNSDVVPLMRVVGADSSAGAAPVIQVIPAAWEVPAALEGTACVYVLQIYSLTKVL